jgi:hypothetical protein
MMCTSGNERRHRGRTREVTSDGLHAPPFDATGQRFEAANVTIESVPVALLSARALSHLGVTLLQLEGLDQSTVTIIVGPLEQLPEEVRLVPVPQSQTSGG